MSESRVAVITGGAQGIGRAIAETLARGGFRVALTDIQGELVAQTAAEIAREYGADLRSYQADVTNEVEVRSSIDAIVADFGRIDVLVNNAGIITSDYALTEDVRVRDFDLMMATHVKGAFLYSAGIVPIMKAQRYGRIFMISSLVGPLGFSRRIGYSTAKAGVLGMMRSLAVEAGPAGVTVNSINPGYILTDAIAERVARGDLDERALLNRIPLERWGKAADIAEVITSMLSPAFDYVTGAEIAVDGGYRIHGDFAAPRDIE